MPLLKSKFVPKTWGSETWLVNNDKYCGKILHLEPGFQCSLHYHPIKEETFYVMSGRVWLEVRSEATGIEFLVLKVGDIYHLPPGTAHRFRAMNGRPAEIMEFSTRHDDTDVVRIEDSRAV